MCVSWLAWHPLLLHVSARGQLAVNIVGAFRGVCCALVVTTDRRRRHRGLCLTLSVSLFYIPSWSGLRDVGWPQPLSPSHTPRSPVGVGVGVSDIHGSPGSRFEQEKGRLDKADWQERGGGTMYTATLCGCSLIGMDVSPPNHVRREWMRNMGLSECQRKYQQSA